jgi:acyl-CoA reductase-like NAD-dependent aldehyde dehydrogenase
MKEEIFGPILPILTYNDDSDWMEYVQARPHPLALYYFDTNKERIERVLRLTLSGGATINDAILHVAQDDLPFGGVGESGFGAYHGFEGFESFSHKKGVMIQSRISGAKFIHPPYRESWKRIMRFLTRL